MILKALNTNWLTFNSKSFPHLHESSANNGLDRIIDKKYMKIRSYS